MNNLFKHFPLKGGYKINEVIKNIKNRRAVRFFSNQKVDDAIIKEILEAGNFAPTGANKQPWRFVVIKDEEVRKKMTLNAKPIYKQFIENADANFKAARQEIDKAIDDSIYYNAPVLIFVIGKKQLSYVNDCSMVCGNMMLAARSLDIGSCWLGFGTMGINDEIAALLELGQDEEIFGPIAFGYPKEGFPPAPDKKPVQVKWI